MCQNGAYHARMRISSKIPSSISWCEKLSSAWRLLPMISSSPHVPKSCRNGTGGVDLRRWTQVSIHQPHQEIGWTHSTSGIADCVVRCLPGEDFTNGFFVSSFIHPEIAQEKPIRSDSTKRKGEFDGDDKHDAPPLKKKKKRKPKGDRST